MIEARYVLRHFRPRSRVVDVGGGEGRLAALIAREADFVVVLDREMTLLEGADNTIYQGSLRRLLDKRLSDRVHPLRADAAEFPLRSASTDLIVSCQLLEHIDSASKVRFFEESARCLKPTGVLAISTPCADFMDHYPFRLTRTARRLLPAPFRGRLPRSLRGPWLDLSVEEWEAKVGHYGHGCYSDELRAAARKAGLECIDERAMHTRMTCLWLEVMFVFPLIAMLFMPVIRVLYEVEARLSPAPGINLLMTFRKQKINCAVPVSTDFHAGGFVS